VKLSPERMAQSLRRTREKVFALPKILGRVAENEGLSRDGGIGP
jgi:hypothetical protein